MSTYSRCIQSGWSQELPLAFSSLLAEQRSWTRMAIHARCVSNSALREHRYVSSYQDVQDQLGKDGEIAACDLRGISQRAEKFAREIKRSRLGVKGMESSPVNAGLYSYYLKKAEEDGAACVCRKPRREVVDGERNPAIMLNRENASIEQVVLDPREIGQSWGGSKDIWIDQMRISRQGEYIAIIARYEDDRREILVKDIKHNVLRRHEGLLPYGEPCSIEWSSGNLLYHTTACSLGIPNRVWRSNPGSTNWGYEKPILIYEEFDPRYFVSLQRTKDWSHVLVNAHSKSSSEVHAVHEGGRRVQCIRKRAPNVEYCVEHSNGIYFILSNIRNGTEYDLFACPKKDTSASQWICIQSSGVEEILEDFTVNNLGCTLLKRSSGIPYVEFLAFGRSVDTSYKELANIVTQTYRMPMPTWRVMSIQFGPNEDYFDSLVEFDLSSPITPSISATWDLKSKKLILGKDCGSLEWSRVKPGSDQFKIDTISCPVDASTAIPITLVSKSIKNSRIHPCLILSYGAYGEMLDLQYQSWFMPLLERDWNIAFVHIRGGGELGKRWHNEGSGIHKLNSSADLKLAIDYLIRKGFATRGKCAAMTNSAGAIALGTMLNTSPELLQAVILESPFVDVLNTMSDPHLPLTQHEYDEFGDPSTPEGKRLVESICPVTGVRSQGYPHMLISTGETDNHVPKDGIITYVNALRANNTSGTKVVLWENAYRNHLPDDAEVDKVRSIQMAFMAHFLC